MKKKANTCITYFQLVHSSTYKVNHGEKMKMFMLASSVIVPSIMYMLQRIWPVLRRIFHILAFIALIVLGNVSAFTLYDVILDEAVYSFNIHGIFLNPLFLVAGMYLGVYLIYLLMLKSVERNK